MVAANQRWSEDFCKPNWLATQPIRFLTIGGEGTFHTKLMESQPVEFVIELLKVEQRKQIGLRKLAKKDSQMAVFTVECTFRLSSNCEDARLPSGAPLNNGLF